MRLFISILMLLLLNISSIHAQSLTCPAEYYVIACRAPLDMKVSVKDVPINSSGTFKVVDRKELFDLHFNHEQNLENGRQFRNGSCTFLDRAIRRNEPNIVSLDLPQDRTRDVKRNVLDQVTQCNLSVGCQFRLCAHNTGGKFITDLSSVIIKPGG